jgi:hypothetical protein
MADQPSEPLTLRANYTVVAQGFDELQSPQSAPAVSMAQFLTEQNTMELVRTISIYAERGTTREQLRLLYMNETALNIWKKMGRKPTEIGTQHRPPATAVLAFGMPFSE